MRLCDIVERLLRKYRKLSHDIARSSYEIPHKRESQQVFENDQNILYKLKSRDGRATSTMTYDDRMTVVRCRTILDEDLRCRRS